MSHMVTYRSADGQPTYHPMESLEEAMHYVEQLRNAGQAADARIFQLHEVPIAVKTYYRVEVAADDRVSTPPPPAMPEPPSVSAAATVPPVSTASKSEPAAAASASGGRFGLFGKS